MGNTYGFHKVNAPESVGGLEFSHPSFKQGSKKLLSQVRRRNSKTKKVEKIAKNQPIADQRVAEALFSLVKRQEESDQLLASVCKELDEAKSMIASLSSPLPASCGKRSFDATFQDTTPFFPVAKQVKTEPETLPETLFDCDDLFNIPAQEMISFDNMFQFAPTEPCSSTASAGQNSLLFNPKEILDF